MNATRVQEKIQIPKTSEGGPLWSFSVLDNKHSEQKIVSSCVSKIFDNYNLALIRLFWALRVVPTWDIGAFAFDNQKSIFSSCFLFLFN